MPEANGNYFPIICIGGSAGGLDAYGRLLKNLPNDTDAAVVIVNHMRTLRRMLPEIPPRYTQMPVEIVTEKLLIKPNQVLVIPENRDLHVLNGEFKSGPEIVFWYVPRILPGPYPAYCREAKLYYDRQF